MDKRHGKKHIAVLTFPQMLDRMKRFASFTLSVLSLSILTSSNRRNQSERYQKIKCDCCGIETMGELRDDKVVIMDKRHGKRHIAVLTLPEILNRMALAKKAGRKKEVD